VSVQVVRSIERVRSVMAGWRGRGASVGLAPTMGALHAGHGALIEAARRDGGCVVVSIFVNPIQFNQAADYDRYPRPLETDLRYAEERGADVVFVPEIAEMYRRPTRAFVEVERLTQHLCGRFRPGHFRGVATVVAKLFHIVQPDRAYFGEKDAQQLAVIRRMVADLDFPVEVVGVETVREPDGLALSSRNQRLSAEERAVAPALYRALRLAAERICGGTREAEEVKRVAAAELGRHPQIRVEYFEVVDPEELQPVEQIRGPVLVAVAAWIGETRLIDNVAVKAS
jgi:pantoate--beta-alanine ligase